MGYPVAYRQGAEKYRGSDPRLSPQAFEGVRPRREGAVPAETFRRSTPQIDFGKLERGLAERFLRQSAEKLLRRTLLRQAGVGLALDAVDLIEVITESFVEVPQPFDPDVHMPPGEPAPDFPGWYHEHVEWETANEPYLVRTAERLFTSANWRYAAGSFWSSNNPNETPPQPLDPQGQPVIPAGDGIDLNIGIESDVFLPGTNDRWISDRWQPLEFGVPQPWPQVVVRQPVPGTAWVDLGFSTATKTSMSPGVVREADYTTEERLRERESELERQRTTIRIPATGSAIITTGPNRQAPPGSRVRERKVVTQLPRLLKFVMENLTESQDAIEALWKALPDQYKSGYIQIHTKNGLKWVPKKSKRKRAKGRFSDEKKYRPRHDEMLRDLYNNFDKVDLNDALYNAATNQLEDMAIGKTNQRITKNLQPWYRRMKRPVGLGTGTAL